MPSFHVLLTVSEISVSLLAHEAASANGGRSADSFASSMNAIRVRADLIVSPSVRDAEMPAPLSEVRWRTTETCSISSSAADDDERPLLLHLWVPLSRVLRSLRRPPPSADADVATFNPSSRVTIHVTMTAVRQEADTTVGMGNEFPLRSTTLDVSPDDISTILSVDRAPLRGPIAAVLSRTRCLHDTADQPSDAAREWFTARQSLLACSSVLVYDPIGVENSFNADGEDVVGCPATCPRELLPVSCSAVSKALQCSAVEDRRFVVSERCKPEFQSVLDVYAGLLVEAEAKCKAELAAEKARRLERQRDRGTSMEAALFVSATTQYCTADTELKKDPMTTTGSSSADVSRIIVQLQGDVKEPACSSKRLLPPASSPTMPQSSPRGTRKRSPDKVTPRRRDDASSTPPPRQASPDGRQLATARKHARDRLMAAVVATLPSSRPSMRAWQPPPALGSGSAAGLRDTSIGLPTSVGPRLRTPSPRNRSPTSRGNRSTLLSLNATSLLQNIGHSAAMSRESTTRADSSALGGVRLSTPIRRASPVARAVTPTERLPFGAENTFRQRSVATGSTNTTAPFAAGIAAGRPPPTPRRTG